MAIRSMDGFMRGKSRTGYPLGSDIPVSSLLLLLLVIVATLKPVGYVGGGGDDWQYLAAARCWAAHGICMPHNHWSARWPLIAPMAASIKLFGETRTTVEFASFLYTAAALLLLGRLTARLFGQIEALIAGVAMLATPVFTLGALKPEIDVVELAFLLAAVTAWNTATTKRKPLWAVATGMAFALAVQTRETSLAYLLIAGIVFLRSPVDDRKLMLWAVPGFATMIVAESLFLWHATGDPLLRLHLALHHTQLQSSELSASVDTSRSPLLNPAFIAGWRPSNGIHLYWPIDPILNLLSHPEIGMTLLAALLLLASAPSGARRNTAGKLVLIATCGAMLLIYVLAIDPKPRMFLPLVAASSMAIGAMAPIAWRNGRRTITTAVLAILFGQSASVIAASSSTYRLEPMAASWIVHNPNAITMDETTKRVLALVPAARSLPVDDNNRSLRLAVSDLDCSSLAGSRSIVVRSYGPPDWHVSLIRNAHTWLCLFERPARDTSGNAYSIE
jgi:hypothetical protein